MTNEKSRLAGTFVAAADANSDTAQLLGTAGAKLDEVGVPEAAWLAFARVHLVDAWQAIADGLLGPYEEAWFAVDALAQFRALAHDARAELDDGARSVLDDVMALAERAASRGVPLVFTG